MEERVATELVARLRGSTERGELVLFTGAGFSDGARNRAGDSIPSATELRSKLWSLAFDGEPDDDSTLQEIFDVVRQSRPGELTASLRAVLSVDPGTVLRHHRVWLSFPWQRAYTVNIDDLEVAASSTLSSSRELHPVSSLRDDAIPDGPGLAFVHLNGDLADLPDVTFSERQYAARQLREDARYSRLVSDLNVAPVIFVGTSLREDPLWRYVEMRRMESPAEADLQPRSFLVSPRLSVARQGMLSTLNIEWVQADAAEFAAQVLDQLSTPADAGHRALARARAESSDGPVPTIRELLAAADPDGQSEYLAGAEPTWGDVIGGRTIEREFEQELEINRRSGVVLITSTAGEGTTTSLMRLGARLHGSGRETLFCDAKDYGSGQRLRVHLAAKPGDFAVVIDDADMLGPQLEHLLRDLEAKPGVLVILGMRSSRIDAALPHWDHAHPGYSEVSVPRLEDGDIAALLALLEREQRLGLLRPLSHDDRVAQLRDLAGRQLLIAMIMATEGWDLKQKAEREYADLAMPQRTIYGVIAVATGMRYPITRDECLQAAQATSAVGATSLERLIKRGLVKVHKSGLELRHRTVAEIVLRRMDTDGTYTAIHRNLLVASAMRLTEGELGDRKIRAKSIRYRFVRRLMAHTAAEKFSLGQARQLYADSEAYLQGDYHYWLQRASYEVRHGSLDAAERYLARADRETEGDFRIDVERSYMLIKKATARPHAPGAPQWARDAFTTLLGLVDEKGANNSYPAHVLLSQYSKYLASAEIDRAERVLALEQLRTVAQKAERIFTHEMNFKELRRKIDKLYFSLAVDGSH